MELQTHIPLVQFEKRIDYYSNVALLGSCFSDSMGHKLAYYQFNTCINPFGVVYNPISLLRLFERTLEAKEFTKEDFFYDREQWQSYELHSSFNQTQQERAVEKVNESLRAFKTFLDSATHLILTLGTAWVYTLKEGGSIVSNCHKQEASKFSKRILSVSEIELALEQIQKMAKSLNPELKLIFTISPVRHLKDGFVENQRSKAHLITALHSFLEKDSNADYFPSYEILLDELRDYRFYDRDLLHPNALGVDSIWEHFREAYLDKSTMEDVQLVSQIQTGLAHRPFNVQSDAHQKFLLSIEAKKAFLLEKYPIKTWTFNT